MGKTHSNDIIGVLGGMGPQASAEFYRILIDKSIKEFDVMNNDEFPEILIDSIPVPDFISNEKNIDVARNLLIDRVLRLYAFGAGVICIPCNTAHILINDFRSASKVPVVSILEEMRLVVTRSGYKRVGLFASPTTLRMNLYDVFNKDVALITPLEDIRKKLDHIIRGVIAGENRQVLQKELTDLAEPFIKQNQLEALILGCTELPVISPINLTIPVISSLDVLADKILSDYFIKN